MAQPHDRAETIADLERRLGHYRQTRRTSPRSLRHWCDTLIRDAEAELRRLRGEADCPGARRNETQLDGPAPLEP